MVRDIERIETQSNMMHFAVFRTNKRNPKFPVKLHIQREERREALPIRKAYVVLQDVNVGIGVPAMHVRNRAEFETSRQRKYPPSNNAVWNIVGQNAIYVGPNDGLCERNQYG
jgi:hypothetical protein